MDEQTYSNNPLAKELLGCRKSNFISITSPIEEGYLCPICKQKGLEGWSMLDDLQWSEYNGFLWCRTCNLDIPSCLCVKPSSKRRLDIIRATSIFLSIMKDATIKTNETKVSEVKLQ